MRASLRIAGLIVTLLLGQGGIQQAHAFPWDYLARTWWTSNVEDDQIEFAVSYEYGRVVYYRPEYRLETVYRVLQETDDKALIITRKDINVGIDRLNFVPTEIYFTVDLLCFYPGEKDLRRNNLISMSAGPFEATTPIIPWEEAFYTFSTEELLSRVKYSRYFNLPIDDPATCKDLVDNNYGSPEKIKPGIPINPDWRFYWRNPAGKRTVYPRSGF